MYNQEPSFIYLCSVTDSDKVADYYRTGTKAKINKNSHVPELKKEEIEYIEQKKSLYLATILENRKESDISFEDFPFYQNYLPKTMNDPDEVYELMDSEETSTTAILKPLKRKEEVFTLSLYVLRAITSKQESNEVYPVIAVPSTCVNFYKSFQSESVISRSIKN